MGYSAIWRAVLRNKARINSAIFWSPSFGVKFLSPKSEETYAVFRTSLYLPLLPAIFLDTILYIAAIALFAHFITDSNRRLYTQLSFSLVYHITAAVVAIFASRLFRKVYLIALILSVVFMLGFNFGYIGTRSVDILVSSLCLIAIISTSYFINSITLSAAAWGYAAITMLTYHLVGSQPEYKLEQVTLAVVIAQPTIISSGLFR